MVIINYCIDLGNFCDIGMIIFNLDLSLIKIFKFDYNILGLFEILINNITIYKNKNLS